MLYLNIFLKRVYDVHPPYEPDIFLIDRLWPRGIAKVRLNGVIWLKDIAPTNELRKQFHQQGDWQAFVKDYTMQLNSNAAVWRPLLEIAKKRPLTLLYGSKDAQHNHAIVLRNYLLAECV
ncbi:putative uroporphyrin-III c-methyltransferase [Yersinia nurmii]|uniref:Uroporphyrin-III c-methyltransferase n=1 Tax=Yersinia nurmii TaxID=685706 RepID=A0ABP1YDG4_9GAMM|nr:DUF488 family protein [Yersinia nurmii]CNE40250.1 putative uroporphyrin-III c-methyltransferase [Yersinia nurmii]